MELSEVVCWSCARAYKADAEVIACPFCCSPRSRPEALQPAESLEPPRSAASAKSAADSGMDGSGTGNDSLWTRQISFSLAGVLQIVGGMITAGGILGMLGSCAEAMASLGGTAFPGLAYGFSAFCVGLLIMAASEALYVLRQIRDFLGAGRYKNGGGL